MEWISVKDRLPDNEETVLICAEVRTAGRKPFCLVVRAFHTDGKTNTEDSAYSWDFGEFDAEYDADKDAYIIPAGWWESTQYVDEFTSVSDFVTHWMPLPEPPKMEPIQWPGGRCPYPM